MIISPFLWRIIDLIFGLGLAVFAAVAIVLAMIFMTLSAAHAQTTPNPENPFPQKTQEFMKADIDHLVSNILAGSLCENVALDGQGIINHIISQSLVLDKGKVMPLYLAAIKAHIDNMEAVGREAWCAATIEAASERGSEMLIPEPK
jgi:hypothetical protein